MCQEDSYRKGRYQIRGVLLSQIELGPIQGVAQLPVRRSNLTTQLRENNDVTNRNIYESLTIRGAWGLGSHRVPGERFSYRVEKSRYILTHICTLTVIKNHFFFHFGRKMLTSLPRAPVGVNNIFSHNNSIRATPSFLAYMIWAIMPGHNNG